MIYLVWSSWNNLYYFTKRDEGREKREREEDLPMTEGGLVSAPHGGREDRGDERLGSFGFSFSWVNYHIRIRHLVG